jgi:uncharacterized SAM-binding protein YcdF (DUF218 family)
MWWLSPLSWLLLALAALVVSLRWGERLRLWRRCCAAVIVVSIVAMTPWVANLLVRSLEGQVKASAACRAQSPAIAVVLGGGVDRKAHEQDNYSVLTLASRRRAEAAARWWREVPGRTLVLSGGSGWPGSPSEARLMAAYLRAMGIPEHAMRLETHSRTTWENARQLAAMKPALPREVVLVTSALHMPRADFSLRQAGFSPCPLPTDERYVGYQHAGFLVPDSGGLVKSQAALHEWVGLLAYRLYDGEAALPAEDGRFPDTGG